jgi:translation elongation factor EF-4
MYRCYGIGIQVPSKASAHAMHLVYDLVYMHAILQVGYVIAGMKHTKQALLGDTLMHIAGKRSGQF